MEFRELVLRKLSPIFSIHNFKVSEELENSVEFESENLAIALVHNVRENSNSLFVTFPEWSVSMEITNEIMIGYFKSEIQIDNLPMEAFVSNVYLFLEGIGKKILEGDKETLVTMQTFGSQISKKHTADGVRRHYLNAADEAWAEGRFSDVVESLDKLSQAMEECGEEGLSAVYKMKYKIAKKWLNS